MNTSLENLDEWTNRHRPTALLLTVTLTIGIAALVNWAIGSDLFQQLFYPDRESVADVRFWSALVYAAAFGMGLPVAFLLWHWRDRNVRDQLENARKDTNLTEFQEVQLRAAGALDEKLPAEAREQLQIAALHQLRGFLRGDYGDSFKRPAFELLLSGHSQAIKRIGLSDSIKSVIKNKKKNKLKIRSSIDTAKNLLNDVDVVRISIFREELKFIFLSGFPLTGRNFDLLEIGVKHDGFDPYLSFRSVDFSKSSFVGASFDCVSADSCNFESCELYGTDLSFTNLRASRFWEAKMDGAELFETDIRGANFATIDPDDLSGCYNACIDDDTWLRPAWSSIDLSLRNAAQLAWIERDAIFDSDE